MQFSTLSLFINVAFGDGCNAENPKTSAMTDSFKSHYDDVASAGTIDQLTGGTAAFREYVQQCASGEGTAQASNQYEHEDDYFPLNFAEEIGGTTMFYNRKSVTSTWISMVVIFWLFHPIISKSLTKRKRN
jgi:hypothetical protein